MLQIHFNRKFKNEIQNKDNKMGEREHHKTVLNCQIGKSAKKEEEKKKKQQHWNMLPYARTVYVLIGNRKLTEKTIW